MERRCNNNNETYFGFIKTVNARLVLTGCQLGFLPKMTRRLDYMERKQIRSGSIFVFEERSSHIRRWTDGTCLCAHVCGAELIMRVPPSLYRSAMVTFARQWPVFALL